MATIRSLLTYSLILFFANSIPLFASPLPPPVSASQSQNGRFLATVSYEYENGGAPTSPLRIVRAVFKVMEREHFLNFKDRINAPVPFWSERWTVRLPQCVCWPMVSNDGTSLILINITVPEPTSTALRVYRKGLPFGQLVREYKVNELQDTDRATAIRVYTDASPQWFAGGIFSFSTEGQFLVYRSQSNSTIRIDLATGALKREKPVNDN